MAVQEQDSIPYNVPAWSGRCPDVGYAFQVIKNGCEVDRVSLSNVSHLSFGRADNVDVRLDHPSVSRYQAVCQYRSLGRPREIGWYLFDMGSTHGTLLNKEKLSPCMYSRLKVGHVLRFAGSSRLYVLEGPAEDEEPESDISMTEAKNRANKQKAMMAERKAKHSELPEAEEVGSSVAKKDAGVDWGLLSYGEEEGQNEDSDKSVSGDSEEGQEITFEQLEQREQYYKDDPKRALQKFFDREGYELHYDCTETNPIRHQWTCRIELPVEDGGEGKCTVAQAIVSGTKKNAIIQCALEACRILDARGVLRKSKAEAKVTRRKRWEDNDYYDSDEDTFYDRTGELEQKRQKRMQRYANTAGASVDTYETLVKKLEAITKEVEEAEAQLSLISAESNLRAGEREAHLPAGKDSLDEYMLNMERIDKKELKVQQSRLKVRLAELKKVQKRTQLLVKITKPPTLPVPKFSKQGLSMVGPMRGQRQRGQVAPVVTVTNEQPTAPAVPEFIEEFDEEDEAITEEPQTDTLPKEEREPIKEKVKKLKPNRKYKIIEEGQGEEGKYSDWLPPEGQTGDGRTKLNETLGY